jgi:HK97 gp10 family phage protein
VATQRVKILDDPDRRLSGLKRGMRNRILRKAVRAGSRIVSQGVKGRVARKSGATKASISVRIATSRKTGAVYAVIGPRRRFVFKRKGRKISEGAPTKIAHLIEKGTRPHSIRKGARLGRKGRSAGGQVGRPHPGARAKPFLRPSWESHREAAVAAMRSVIAAELAKLGGDAGS